MVQLCYVENISIIFPSNTPVTLVCTVHTGELGITPKTPSGGHASLDKPHFKYQIYEWPFNAILKVSKGILISKCVT